MSPSRVLVGMPLCTAKGPVEAAWAGEGAQYRFPQECPAAATEPARSFFFVGGEGGQHSGTKARRVPLRRASRHVRSLGQGKLASSSWGPGCGHGNTHCWCRSMHVHPGAGFITQALG